MLDPIYNRIEGQARPGIFAASGFILLACFGLWLSQLALGLIGAEGAGLTALENAVYYLPFMLLPVAVALLRRPALSDAMRLNPLPALPTLSVVLLGLLSVYLAAALAEPWGLLMDALGLHSPGTFPVADSPRALAISIITMAAVPAVCEELLFRGFCMAAWESRGTWFAVGVTAVLFALLHGSVYGLPAYLLVGAVSGFVVFALDSLYAGIVYHTVYNAACLVIPYLMAGQADEAAQIAMTPALFASMALQVLAVAAMAAMLIASLRVRARNAGIEPIPRIRRPLSTRDRAMTLACVLAMLLSCAAVLAIAARAAAIGGSL